MATLTPIRSRDFHHRWVLLLALVWLVLPMAPLMPSRAAALHAGTVSHADDPGLYLLLGPFVHAGANPALAWRTVEMLAGLVAIAV